jgi:hypothetical protein
MKDNNQRAPKSVLCPSSSPTPACQCHEVPGTASAVWHSYSAFALASNLSGACSIITNHYLEGGWFYSSNNKPWGGRLTLPYHICGAVKSRSGSRRHRRSRAEEEEEEEEEGGGGGGGGEGKGGPCCLPELDCLATYIGHVPGASICLCQVWYSHHHTILWKH